MFRKIIDRIKNGKSLSAAEIRELCGYRERTLGEIIAFATPRSEYGSLEHQRRLHLRSANADWRNVRDPR